MLMRLCLLFLIFLLSGCVSNDAKTPVKDYLNAYQNHSDKVTVSLNELIKNENLTKEQQDIYELIMKKQYVDLAYHIDNVTYDGNKAIVTATIEVYDYNHSKKEALKEYENTPELNYKDLQLTYMKRENKRIKYTLSFSVYLDNDKWVIENPDYITLQKIHGVFNG